jgi:hypothetical protein
MACAASLQELLDYADVCLVSSKLGTIHLGT